MAAKQTVDRRGRVILRMRGGAASPLVLEAAARVARVFHGELRGLFVEDQELLSLAEMPFAREISLTGRRSRPLSIDLVRREMQAASEAMAREFERLTRAARVPAHFEVVRGMMEDALRSAMEEPGILAIGEPLALGGAHVMREALADLSRFAGLVMVGAEARRAKGPVLTVLDPACDVALLVDTAERLAGEGAEQVILLIADAGSGEAARIERKAREALDETTRYRFERMPVATPRGLNTLAQREACGLVVARLGGPVAGDWLEASRAACALDCPLLLLNAEPAKSKAD